MIAPNSPSIDPAVAPDPLASQPPLLSSTGLDRNVAAGLACLFSIVGGIVFLTLEKRDRFVRFHAMQAVFLGGAMLAFLFAMIILIFVLAFIPFVGWLLIPLVILLKSVVGLAFLALWILTTLKAFSGSEWSIPVLGPLARRQLDSTASGV